ncbi:MAG: SURF1 family protein [Pseudomonadota bacterium]
MHLMDLRVGRWRFAPGLWPTLAAAFFFALTLWLGNWQSGRAEDKRTLQARYDAAMLEAPIHVGPVALEPDSVLHRRIEARGRFDDAHTILLDNRVHAGRAGYHVLTPLVLDRGGMAILVNRGWVGAGPSRAVPPVPRIPPGEVDVEGMAASPQTRYIELGDAAPQGRVWQNLDMARYARTTHLTLQPVLLMQTSEQPDGLVRDWPRPDAGVAMHVSYAFQWYSLATTLAVLWLVTNVRRVRAEDARPKAP